MYCTPKTDALDAKRHNQDVREGVINERPDRKKGWEAFKQFIWNPKTSQILGRTVLSWIKIILFYIIYYICLAAFFLLMGFVFFLTIDETSPKWTVEQSIIGANPGVGFRPSPKDQHMGSSLIWFRTGDDNGDWQEWVTRYQQQFLNDYYTDSDYIGRTYYNRYGQEMNKVDCEKMEPGYNQVCAINRDALFRGDCNMQNDFGFREGKPCIILKLNKIFDWIPAVYDHDYSPPPPDFPTQLNYIFWGNVKKMEQLKKMEGYSTAEPLNDKVWIECHGKHPSDKENLGPMIYYPEMGFSTRFYPYRNQQGYLSPVVFMQMINPKKGVLIDVECKAWAQNIWHNSKDKQGLVNFQVMID